MRKPLRILFGLTASLLLMAGAGASDAAKRPLGDSRVVAHVPPDPGFPEGIAVQGRKMYVSTPAQLGKRGDAKILVFDVRDGDLLREYVVPAKDQATDHALVGVTLDGSDHLYVSDIQRGMVRVDIPTGALTDYTGPFPDLPPCPPGGGGDPCSPTSTDRPPLPNDPAFDAAGFLYVTDSFQATIWRVPPGGGAPHIWFQDPILEGEFGPNGIRMSPDGSEIYFAVTGPGPVGAVYRLPRVEHPSPGDLELFRSYPSEGPDGIAFGKSGKLYVALAFSNQISVLETDGTEGHRFSGPAADDPQPIPWDAPANIAFDNSSGALLVTNHALISGLPQHFAVFDVFVKDRAQPLERPVLQ